MKNGYDHHDHQEIYTYNLSGPKRFTLDVPNQSPPYDIRLTGVAALITCKGLFSSVFTLVLPEIISLSARIVTLVTPESLFSSVCELVPLEVTGKGARIVTLVTPERLLS